MEGHGHEKLAWVVEDIGGRMNLEDDHCLVIGFHGKSGSVLAGVFDGHGGSEVARLAAKKFPLLVGTNIDSGQSPERAFEAAFQAVDLEAVSFTSGAVGVVCLVSGGRAVFANVGDAELLLVSRTSHRVLTELHRLSNESERRRILGAGANTLGTYVMLPNGNGLQCTRSIGDHEFRSVGVIPHPFVGSATLARDDLWLVLACDGLWDVMSHDEVATIARKMVSAKAVAEALHHEAVTVRWTPDNITVIAVAANIRQ